ADVGSSTNVYWSWEDFYKYVRATLPFALIDTATSVAGEGQLYKLRGELANFNPTRVTRDFDGHWSMPFKTRYLGDSSEA
ncbi:hypothetical protein, partial [Streptococcus pneumoniae]|uniref:hypothetical protein n=1 Tax=Streptococcus pneumoniae TaxID=1313 RepID=UPI0018B0299B